MVFGWLRGGGGRGASGRSPSGLHAGLSLVGLDVDTAIDRVRAASHLDGDARARLAELADTFLTSRRFEACGGLALGPGMREHLTLNACVPILELGLEWYRDVRTVLVYPAGFRQRGVDVDEFGIVTEIDDEALGESWEDGPVIVSWEDARPDAEVDPDFDVVVHEFAHKLDLLDGEPDGCPPFDPRLHEGLDRDAWRKVFAGLRDTLTAEDEAGYETTVDPYAASDPAECFAVTSEVFFTRPLVLAQDYPEAYAMLAGFYRQDPAAG